jgi:predicted glycosyltransferase
MKILIEAHHPAHIHFWKYPIRELIAGGHSVRLLGRDRDVMLQLLKNYDWIPATIPKRSRGTGRFPVMGMLHRQFELCQIVRDFKPQVVASLMGSYTQLAKLFGSSNLIFTDSEHQSFNHKIAHPFADEIHTPQCFYKDLGTKQRRYDSIHELAFLDPKYYQPDRNVLLKYKLEAGKYIVIRLSAWNTLHDVSQSGVGERVYDFIEAHKMSGRILLVAEEGKVPPGLEEYVAKIEPQDFHCVLSFARFLLSEGASTASEASCLGVPTVYVNSLPTMGYLKKIASESSTFYCFEDAREGVCVAEEYLTRIEEGGDSFDLAKREAFRREFNAKHIDLVDYVVRTIERLGG